MKVKFKFNRALSRGVLPAGDRRLWLGLRSIALRIELRSTNVWNFEVFYRRLMLVMAGTVLVLWLGAATALHYWLDRAPHNQVGWLDLAAPWRWSKLPAKRGDTAIMAAKDDFAKKDYATAFFNLRAGVARSPGNAEGRLMLARIQASGDPVQSIKLLEDGLPYSYNDEQFLSGLFALYSSQLIVEPALVTADELLQGKYGELSADSRYLLTRVRVTLLLQLARYNEAEQALSMIVATTAEQQSVTLALRIEVLLRAGKVEEAQQLDEQRASNLPMHLRQSVDIAVARGSDEAVQRALRQLKAASPIEPPVYLFAFQAWHRMKRISLRENAETEYYRLFGRDDAAVQAIAALAVNLELAEVVVRAQRVAISARLSPFAFRVHQTELALRAGDLQQAVRSLNEWENDVETLKNVQRFYPEFIKRLTRAVFSGTQDQATYLVSHLSANRGQATLPVYNLAVTTLMKAGNFAGAQQVLQNSLALFPRSLPLLTARATLDEKQVENAKIVAAAAAEKAVAPASQLIPATGEEAISQLADLLKSDQLVAARDLLRNIRAQKPAWQASVVSALDATEVELALLTLDQLASRGLIRSYLDKYRSDDDVSRLVPVVARLSALKRTADARLLYEELSSAKNSSARLQQALRDLNLGDDLAAIVASQTKTLDSLDGWIVAQEWAQAERLLKYLREKQAPEWLAGAAHLVKMREVQVRLGLGQRPAALAAFRDLVLKNGVPRSTAFALVRTEIAHGDHDTAKFLAREVVRLLPDDQAASKLLKETEVPEPTAR
ncbi:hypothetical protein [Oleiharenicola lentus]|uniref:hypothetical protein n=1 Tax=Oleiharenicola lentus TaxID=2508720 RepID=UPI003F6672CF